MTTIGMPSRRPHTPHSQPQNSSEMNTAAAFIRAMRPVIQVVMNTPTRHEAEPTDNAGHHDDGGDETWQLERLQPCDGRAERVGDDDAQKQRHEEGLCP